MIKLYISFIFLAVGFLSLAQKSPHHLGSEIHRNSLVDYSYSIVGFSNPHSPNTDLFQGSGFFMKKDSATYFITARHVVSRRDTDCNEKKDFPYEMSIMPDPLSTGQIWLDLRKYQDTLTCAKSSLKPDLGIFKIPLTTDIFIHAFDASILQTVPDNIERICIYGYPLINDWNMPGFKGMMGIKNVDSIISNVLYFFRNDGKKLSNKIPFITRPFDYAIRPLDYKLTSSIAGFSGSPVFGYSSHLDKWVFIGIVSAVDVLDNMLLIVKSENIPLYSN